VSLMFLLVARGEAQRQLAQAVDGGFDFTGVGLPTLRKEMSNS